MRWDDSSKISVVSIENFQGTILIRVDLTWLLSTAYLPLTPR